MGLHLVGATMWVGGLIVLVTLHRTLGHGLAVVASRYSTLALWSYVAVGTSGVVAATTRLAAWSDLLMPYGVLLVAKAVLFVALGAAGWWHRRSTLADLDAGLSGRAFLRLAVAEVALMGAAFGIATALSRSAPPVPEDFPDPTPTLQLTGFPAPPDPGTTAWWEVWRADWLLLAAVVVALGLYAAGVLAVRAASAVPNRAAAPAPNLGSYNDRHRLARWAGGGLGRRLAAARLVDQRATRCVCQGVGVVAPRPSARPRLRRRTPSGGRRARHPGEACARRPHGRHARSARGRARRDRVAGGRRPAATRRRDRAAARHTGGIRQHRDARARPHHAPRTPHDARRLDPCRGDLVSGDPHALGRAAASGPALSGGRRRRSLRRRALAGAHVGAARRRRARPAASCRGCRSSPPSRPAPVRSCSSSSCRPVSCSPSSSPCVPTARPLPRPDDHGSELLPRDRPCPVTAWPLDVAGGGLVSARADWGEGWRAAGRHTSSVGWRRGAEGRVTLRPRCARAGASAGPCRG